MRCCPVQSIHEGHRQADQYLNYSVLRETVKWSKNVVLYLLNCALLNAFFVYRTLNTNKNVKYKNFLHEVGRSWISEVQNRSSDDLKLPEKQTKPRGPNRTRQADSPGFQNTQTGKNCCWWGGKTEVSCKTV